MWTLEKASLLKIRVSIDAFSHSVSHKISHEHFIFLVSFLPLDY
jgi:hypothetical protein